MLILHLKRNEKVIIVVKGVKFEVNVHHTSEYKTSLAFDAPREVEIIRDSAKHKYRRYDDLGKKLANIVQEEDDREAGDVAGNC